MTAVARDSEGDHVSMNMPTAEVDVTASLVRRLLAEQRPDLCDLPLLHVANGWDNVIFRLGDDLSVRLPRRQASAELIVAEQRWLPSLAKRLPLEVAAPLWAGQPSDFYPWAWSLHRWLPGSVAAVTPLQDPMVAAESLGRFLAALHQPAPPDAPINPYRGIPLADRSDRLFAALDALAGLIDGDAVRSLWGQLVGATAATPPAVWIHGDLHPANILVHDGAISAVIDFGDLTSGDRATDLAIAWMMLPPDTHATFRSACDGVDDDTWMRARGWALALGLAYLVGSADNPLMHHVGLATVAAALRA